MLKDGDRALELSPNDIEVIGGVSYLYGLSGWGCHSSEKLKKKYNIGSCKICAKTNTKVCNEICRDCEKGLKGFRYNVDTLKNAMLYLDENNK